MSSSDRFRGPPRQSAARLWFRSFSWPLVAILLSACGFHLQGAADLPEDLQRVYIATADELTPFASELRNTLTRNGAELARAAREADAIVRVVRDRSGRRVLSVSARNTPEEFEIFYSVEYSIDRGGAEAVPLQTLEITRTLSFDESKVLAKDREEEILRTAMARDLATLVVRRIASL